MKITQRLGARAITAITMATVVVASGLIGTQTATADLSAGAAAGPPAIVRTESGAGFAHPGVGFTADHLENARTQVLAGTEPWVSYYAAMTDTRYAAPDFRAENAQPGTDLPKNNAYASAGMRSIAHRDGIGAMTQALQYVITGEEQYRANALHVLRTWSSLDPAKYAYFSDAHIHTGVPLYYMLIAAEIVRSTESATASPTGYDLTWSAADEERLESNLIRPVLDTFLSSKNRLWNQHLYGVIGMVAAAIYLDDADLYAERVEWFTVNAGYESEHDLFGGDVNGALASIFREIPADDPRNTTGSAFVQHMEMLRDQAHGQGDVDLLAALARLVDSQGTRLDPTAGTVSEAPDAVSPYHFLDDRILAGADTFYAFMMGEEVPAVAATDGGALSQAYRGRLLDPLSETYLQYRYEAGVDVETEAPHVAELYEHRDGPLFYNGPNVQNFWSDRGSDYTGAEYWVAFPEELANVPEAAAPLSGSAELTVETFGSVLGGGAERSRDADGPEYIRLDASASDARLAVRRAVWADRNRTSLVGVRVRSDGTARLLASRSSTDAPFAEIAVPDTEGQWRYVWLDLHNEQTIGAVGDNILVLQATGSRAQVDVAAVLAQANGVLTPPTFSDAPSFEGLAVVDEPWSRAFVSADDAELSLGLQGAPEGATLSGSELEWTPRRTGVAEMSLVASDGTTVTALPVAITVVETRSAAIAEVASRVGDSGAYTSETWRGYEEALARAEAAATTEPAEFGQLLEQLQTATAELVLLDPRLPDGSLDLAAVVSTPALTAPQVRTLVDGDNQTHWGDQRISSVVLDFGPAFRVRADAFGLQARDSFANRASGTNVYGSSDGATWTLLTEHPNAGRDAEIEWLDVRADARDERYRFLKLQVDEPGVPSDPAYPGIWSIAEFRIDGARTEAVGSMDAVTISSPDAVAGRIVAGDDVEVRLSGPAANTEVVVSVLGTSAAVTSPGAGEWLAALEVPSDAPAGRAVDFTVDFVTPSGATAETISATTDGSKLWLASDAGLIDTAFREARVLRPDGEADAVWAQNAARMFDGDAATHSDTRVNDGTYGIVWDFGPDERASLSGAELLVRQDGYGMSRIADLRLEGSDDLENWTRLTPGLPTRTLDWQSWDVSVGDAFRYVRIANGQILGVAELRLFGDVASPLPAPEPWQSDRVYDAGDRVSVGATTYVAQWWTRGQRPGTTTTGSWMEEGGPVAGAGVDTRAWTASWVYTAGDTVAHEGRTWEAAWWTRDQVPGAANGPWRLLASG